MACASPELRVVPCLSLSGARITGLNQSAKKAQSTQEPSADALCAAAGKQGLRAISPFVSRDRQHLS